MLFYKIVRFIAKIYLYFYLDLKYIGLDNIVEGKPYIICSNHISNFDAIAISIKVKSRIVFLGKKELFKYKLSSWFFKRLGVISVDRGESGQDLIDDCSFVIKSGGILGIFPEGTRSNTDALLKFKSGVIYIAASSKANILPVAIKKNTQKIGFRTKYVVKFGKMLNYEELEIDCENKRSFAIARKRLMDVISNLLMDINF